MAKLSAIKNNEKKIKLCKKNEAKRKVLKDAIYDKKKSLDERHSLTLKLASLSRNSSWTRVRNRCSLTGRPRGNYQKFMLCRNMLRDLANKGLIAGLKKSSW